ncbi:histidine phosphotransferase ChpT [Rhizomicrobium palustre]|uniref:Histidine phosphotransferase ChpT n=1 Tax=Rhizomicrobium palustre TaxID=189966 RepID=A0A846N0C3_9PROT|nr:histidine phosphotransferase family protein [Rhizomicrobium palustre]NIK89013.1 histidine phosphotransferase ChpT [Rhizomicrobium palustre]
MNDIEFSAFLVSRVCHDLVGPLGAVVNGLEVLEDERDAAMRADALKIVTSSAAQALARLQFMRIAFGAAGSAGAELDLGEVGRLVTGLLSGGRLSVEWEPSHAHWPKDWAKLLMNAALIAADCLPRGGLIRISTPEGAPGFTITAEGTGVRISEDVAKALHGEALEPDARGVQPILTYRLARGVNAGLTITLKEGFVEIVAG